MRFFMSKVSHWDSRLFRQEWHAGRGREGILGCVRSKGDWGAVTHRSNRGHTLMGNELSAEDNWDAAEVARERVRGRCNVRNGWVKTVLVVAAAVFAAMVLQAQWKTPWSY